jgi:alpha-tubulin suppressor-like RCC1 family protein
MSRCFTAVLKDVRLYNWGWNNHGELGRGSYNPVVIPSSLESIGDIEKITVGMNHTIVLKRDGTVWSWGYNKLMGKGVLGIGSMDGSNIPLQINALHDIREIYSGFNHNFAIQKNGTIWAWGNNNNKRLGPINKETE